MSSSRDGRNSRERRRRLKSELVPIASLSLDPANLRKHPEKNLQAIVASLKRFGQQKPIVIDANGIVRAGNGTLLAAKQLGWNEIEIVRSTLKGSEATAYAIADNRTAELAEWDTDALGAALEALRAEGEGLDLAAGFDESELEKLCSRFKVEEVPLGELASGEREPFQQMTFVLHDSQEKIVREALGRAISSGLADAEENQNRNGNAIASICESWLRA